MTITMNRNDTELTVTVDGRLDTLTSPDLEEQLDDALEGVQKLIFDFENLQYISSAGLRVLAGALDAMMEQDGEMFVSGANEDILAVFEITGFTDELNLI